MSLAAAALVLVIVIAGPATVIASARIWPSGDGWTAPRSLDALWTVVPALLLIGLLILSARAGL